MSELDSMDRLVSRTLAESRRPPEPPIDEMWANIEQRAFPGIRIVPLGARRTVHWRAPAIAAAAALVIGAALGTALGWSIAPRTTVARTAMLPAPSTDITPMAAATSTGGEQKSDTQKRDVQTRGDAGVSHSRTRAIAAPQAALVSSEGRHDDMQGLVGGSEMTRYLSRTSALLASLPSTHSGSVSDTAIATRASDLLTQTHLLLDSPAGSDPTLHRLLEDLELVLAQVAHLRARGNGTDLQLIHQALTVHDVLPRVHDATLEASTTD